jgi:hypothetical protein
VPILGKTEINFSQLRERLQAEVPLKKIEAIVKPFELDDV